MNLRADRLREDPEPYRAKVRPSNIIPLKLPTLKEFWPLLQGPKTRRKPRHSSATLTWLYRRFVEGHLPAHPSALQFLTITLPFLVTAMSPEAAIIMGSIFGRRHLPSDQAEHSKAVAAQVHILRANAISSLSEADRARIATLRPMARQNAFTGLLIARSLADDSGAFYIASRDLQRRILASSPIIASRVLDRLERLDILTRTESGLPSWKAREQSEPRKANAYVLTQCVTQ